jgi:predicted HAD superfamily phosphohydrolase
MQKAADEHSPSKETYQIGWFLVKGLLNSIMDKGGMAIDAGANMVTDMLDAIREAMATIPSIMDSDINYNPTITPVLDTTRFNNGLSGLTAALNGNRYATLGANLSVGKVDVGSAVGDLSAITTQGNSDLLAAIQRQNDELARLNYNLENQKIYLDGNTLVGKTVARMDQALGRRAVMAGGRR